MAPSSHSHIQTHTNTQFRLSWCPLNDPRRRRHSAPVVFRLVGLRSASQWFQRPRAPGCRRAFCSALSSRCDRRPSPRARPALRCAALRGPPRPVTAVPLATEQEHDDARASAHGHTSTCACGALPSPPTCDFGQAYNTNTGGCYDCYCGTYSAGGAATSCFACNTDVYPQDGFATLDPTQRKQWACSTCPVGKFSERITSTCAHIHTTEKLECAHRAQWAPMAQKGRGLGGVSTFRCVSPAQLAEPQMSQEPPVSVSACRVKLANTSRSGPTPPLPSWAVWSALGGNLRPTTAPINAAFARVASRRLKDPRPAMYCAPPAAGE